MILIAAGSSLPFCGLDSQQIVAGAIAALSRIIRVDAVSAFYQTPAWPDQNDPPFVNAAIRVTTAWSPEGLYSAMQSIEAGFGRLRGAENAPRTLDLDLIAYGDLVQDGAAGSLILPHPRLAMREFVLRPLADIAPHWRAPTTGQTIEAMLAEVGSATAIQIFP